LNKKPNILVTNDDGISSPGIKSLIEVTGKYGNLTVIAPDKPMSGVGHAITMRKPIIIEAVTHYNGISSWKCSGTPVDCVKFGLANILKEKPQLVVSGINHGSNASINALYSGTVAAAIEGCLEGISSIAFSLTNWEEDADMTITKKVVKHVIEKVLEHDLPKGILLNVNVPDVAEKDFKGIMICRQARIYWHERFIEEVDDDGNKMYWLSGEFSHNDKREDTDQWAIENNYAAIVPLQIDLTAHHLISHFKKFELL